MDCRLFLGFIALTAVAAQQPSTPLVVYGALGGSVDFNLYHITLPQSYQLSWTTEGGTIVIGRISNNNPPVYNPAYVNRCQLFPSGTLRLKQLTRNDEREYMVTVTNPDHFTAQTVNYQLNVYVGAPPTPLVLVNGTLGGSVVFNLYIAFPQNYQITWSTGGIIITGRISNNPPLINPDYVHRCQLFSNGTLRLEHLTRDDERRYTVTIYNQNERTGQAVDYQLDVYVAAQQPPSSLVLVNGALGGSVDFNLYHITFPQNYQLSWATVGDSVIIGRIVNNKPPVYNPDYVNRCQLFPSGTLRLEHLTRDDEKLYTVTIHNLDDLTAQIVNYQLKVYVMKRETGNSKTKGLP